MNEQTVHPYTHAELERLITNQLESYGRVFCELKEAQVTEGHVTHLHDLKDGAHDLLRTLQGVTAALLTATDWQSPSFAHTIRSQAGTQTGKIEGTLNDYKRDFHLDGNAYERAFRSEFIDTSLRLPPPTQVTANGMAAFSTVLTCLDTGGQAQGTILAGHACYFQNKILLERFFPGRIHYVDEMDTDKVIAAVDEQQPSVIFLDSLCNTEYIQMPDLATLIPTIARRIQRYTTLVLDNTGLASTFQPLNYLPRTGKLRLIVVESLMKYHQYGFDRVTAGIIWRSSLTPTDMSVCRMHLGTNIADASVAALPKPNRALLTKRLARFERNATYLATRLEEHIASLRLTPLSHVVYPGLASYPGYAWTHAKPFHGSFFTIAFKAPFDKPLFYQRFMSYAVAEAKTAGMQVTAGTSFGFSNTRIYVTALHANNHAKPFLRVSVGTETYDQIVRLGDALTRAANRMSL